MELPGSVRRAMDLLEGAGYAAYAVGGCVRDWALGMTPHDYDVCTAAPPEEMKRVFAGYRTLETGLKHGTLTVLMDGAPIEITAFRLDGDYRDGRHPDSVRFTGRIEDDLSRRDFTVNAMAYSPLRGLADPFGGRADCQRGVIRCVGDARTRFQEDSLRVLRALRFSARLGFEIEAETAKAVHEEKTGLRRVSRERIAAELNGLLLGGGAGKVLTQYADVVGEALEGLWPAGGSAALAAARVDACPPELPVRWAALLLDGDAPQTARAVLAGLKQSAELIGQAGDLTAYHHAWGGAPEESMSLREKLMRAGPEGLARLLSLEQADRTVKHPRQAEKIARETDVSREKLQKLLDENACVSLRQLAVHGGDLLALGYRGREIGEKLEETLLRVVREELPNEKRALLDSLRPGS